MKENIEKLIEAIHSNDWREVQVASGKLYERVDKEPLVLKSHTERLINLLEGGKTIAAQKRNIVRILQLIEIPKDLQGRVFNCCQELMMKPTEAIAVRVFSMTVCTNIALENSGLIPEMELCIQEVLREESVSAGTKNRGEKLLKQLRKK